MSWADEALAPDGEVVLTQAPAGRPAAVPRPGEEMRQAQAIKPPAERQKSGKRWSDEVFETPIQQTPQQKQPEPAKPKAEGWGEWAYNSVVGRQDPKFQGVESLQSQLNKNEQQNRPALKQLYGAAPFAVSSEQQADVAKSALGDRFMGLEKDANGADVITYRGDDGKPVKAYVNAPGLDREDVANGIMQAIPYVLTGGPMGAAMRGASMLPRVVGMGSAAGLTSLAGDVAAMPFGSEQAPDPARAAIAAGAGGATEVIAPIVGGLVRKFITEPRLYDKATGQLTPQGMQAAQQSGLDPQQLTQQLSQEFAKEYARTGSTAVGRSVATREFGVDQSRGQLTKDPGQLLTEKAMRTGGYGEAAKDTMQTFDRTQSAQIEAAARGGPDAKRSVAYNLNTNTPAQGTGPRHLGDGIRSAVREAEQVASADASMEWAKVGKITPTPESIAELPKFLGPKVGNMPIDKQLTPSATAMVEDLRGFMSGDLPGNYTDVVGKAATPDVVEMRKRLFLTMRGAQSETDKATAKAIYEGYGDWIEQSATAALNAGDPAQAAALRVATNKTREMMQIFGESSASGTSPGRQIVSGMIKESSELTPELIVSKLFSVNPGSAPKDGSVEALRLMKQGFQKYLPADRAEAAIADIKLAAWKKLIEDSSGKLHTPATMAKRIDQFFNAQKSIATELMSPEEIALMRRFGAAMKDIAWKDPNPSGTGTANQFYMGQFGQSVMRMLGATNGPIGAIFNTILRSTPITNAVGSVAAQRAVSPAVRSQVPMISPYGAASAVQAQERRSSPGAAMTGNPLIDLASE